MHRSNIEIINLWSSLHLEAMQSFDPNLKNMIDSVFRYVMIQIMFYSQLTLLSLCRSLFENNSLWIMQYCPRFIQKSNRNMTDDVNVHTMTSLWWLGGRFKNTYELLNLKALKFSYVNKIHIFQCMGKIFCVEFQRYPLTFHTKYLTHTLKDMIFMQFWNFKSS